MRSSRCAFSTAAALHRVFIVPIEHSQLTLAQRTTSTFSIQCQLGPSLSQRRNYNVDVKTKAEKSRLPRNSEITAYSVIIANDDGSLSNPRQTKAFLETLDLSKYILQTVAAGGPGKPPICKIQSKDALRAAEKLRKKNNRKTAIGSKTIELNWAIDKGDLKHRMNKLKEFLEKGLKVEVLMASKRKGRRALEDEAMEVVQKIEEAAKEVGAKEYKPREGKLLQQLAIFVEGKKTKPVKEEAGNKNGDQEALEMANTKPEQEPKKRRKRWALPAAEGEEEGDGETGIPTTEKAGQGQKGKHTEKPKAVPYENPSLAALRRAVAAH